MKIIFMGTPDFSASVLQKLNSVYPISAVVTGLDKPVGRGLTLTPPPIKTMAETLNIKVLQYEKVSKEGIADIAALAPDLIVTAAFGQILSQAFLEIPKFGVLNVHASLLPKYRGASPIQWAILNGDTESGITVMKTVKAVDAGDILLQKSILIGEKETAGELFDRLSVLGGEAIIEAVALIESGKAMYTAQDENLVSHCKMIAKTDGKIDFSVSAAGLDCFVRGMSPWPSAYTTLDGKILKVFDVEPVETPKNTLGCGRIAGASTVEMPSAPTCEGVLGVEAFETPKNTFECGEVVVADSKNGLVVACKNGAIRLKTVQIEGSKRMLDTEFLRGRTIEKGCKFQ